MGLTGFTGNHPANVQEQTGNSGEENGLIQYKRPLQ
jgi:hypothetical protein